jgi:hypothetical protein
MRLLPEKLVLWSANNRPVMSDLDIRKKIKLHAG